MRGRALSLTPGRRTLAGLRRQRLFGMGNAIAIGLRSEVSAETVKRLEAFQEALATYRRQEWDKAEALLLKLKESSYAGNKLYELFLSRIPILREKNLGPDWDGAFTFETK